MQIKTYLRAEVEDEDGVKLVVDLSHGGGREQGRRACTRVSQASCTPNSDLSPCREFADKIDACVKQLVYVTVPPDLKL